MKFSEQVPLPERMLDCRTSKRSERFWKLGNGQHYGKRAVFTGSTFRATWTQGAPSLSRIACDRFALL